MRTSHWVEFLALCAAAGAKKPLLAAFLRAHGWPLRATAELPTPAPTAAHWHLAERQAAALTALGLHLVPIFELPDHLAQARPMPPALFVRGNPELLAMRSATAIVGARKAGPKGCAWAQQLAHSLAKRGHLVVSGGAMGVDGAAHRGSLTGGGTTVVYMGTAIDRIYPAFHAALFSTVLQRGGALVSEHPPFAVTFKGDHAKRNRFIAAHSEQLVVVEAALASGTMGAVTFARRLGRRVLVAPREVGGERSGLEDLIARGWAHLYPEGEPS